MRDMKVRGARVHFATRIFQFSRNSVGSTESIESKSNHEENPSNSVDFWCLVTM